MQQGELKRTLGFWALVAYGVGDILGAGIYALIGKIAGIAGTLCWLAFLVTLGVAALTALSYAELSGRFPKSGGEALFTQEGFRKEWLTLLVGWLVLCSGIVSMATVSRSFAGYLQGMWPTMSLPFIVVAFLAGLAIINFRGMRESSAANIICTAIEVFGLLLVIVAGLMWVSREGVIAARTSAPTAGSWIPVLQGAALAFFAFIGFEDMVNVAEEVKKPEQNLPKAILTALAIAGTIYIVVAFVAVAVIPVDELAASSAPLLEVVKRAAPAVPVALFTLIACFAVSNTALLNFVMGSRLIYGMSRQGILPVSLGVVHPKRHTPHIAILVILGVAIVLALSGTLVFLAGTTNVLLLTVFCIVNISLVVVKRRGKPNPGSFSIPSFIPILGSCTSLFLLAFVPRGAFVAALIIVGLGIGLIALKRILSPRVASDA